MVFDLCCAPRVAELPRSSMVMSRGGGPASIGVGWTPAPRSGFFTVAQIIPGSPASESGIQVGDILHTIDGVVPRLGDTEHLRVLITGDPETSVELVLRSEFGGPDKRILLKRRILGSATAWTDGRGSSNNNNANPSSSSSVPMNNNGRNSFNNAFASNNQPTQENIPPHLAALFPNRNSNNNVNPFPGPPPPPPPHPAGESLNLFNPGLSPLKQQQQQQQLDQQQQQQAQAVVYGVGINFYRDGEGVFRIESICCGYPASAILATDDALVAVDSVNVEHSPPETVLRMVRGGRGTQCALSFRSQSKGGEIVSIKLGRFYPIA